MLKGKKNQELDIRAFPEHILMEQGNEAGISTWFVFFLSPDSGHLLGLPWWLRWLSVCLQCGRPGFNPWVGKIPWRKKWQPTPVLLPGKSHGQRGLVGYSPWGHKESETTERLHFTSGHLLTFRF